MTLLEQLVSIVLCAIIMVAATSSYKALMVSSGSLQNVQQSEDRLRNVMHRVAEDMAFLFVNDSLCKMQTRQISVSDGQEILAQFCTTVAPQGVTESAIEQVRYVLQGEKAGEARKPQKLVRQSRAVFVPIERQWQNIELATEVTEFTVTPLNEMLLARLNVGIGNEQSVQGSLMFALPVKPAS